LGVEKEIGKARIKHTSEWKSLHVLERLTSSGGKRGQTTGDEAQSVAGGTRGFDDGFWVLGEAGGANNDAREEERRVLHPGILYNVSNEDVAGSIIRDGCFGAVAELSDCGNSAHEGRQT
jgi:hypothetical protein